MGLNNYTKSYSNIMNWIDNPDLVVRLANIEEGELQTFIAKETKTLAGGKMYRCVSSTKYANVDLLMKERMDIDSVGNFMNYFNRYVRTWCQKNGFNDHFDEYPIKLEAFLAISKLNFSDYNMDKLMEEAVNSKLLEPNVVMFDKYKLSKSTFDIAIINDVLAAFPDKLAEYKSGKTNLLNLFFGEYIKRLADKNIDKNLLRKDLETHINSL